MGWNCKAQGNKWICLHTAKQKRFYLIVLNNAKLTNIAAVWKACLLAIIIDVGTRQSLNPELIPKDTLSVYFFFIIQIVGGRISEDHIDTC